MFTDIKGFTARTSKSTRADLVSLLKTHEEIVLPLAKARGGTLIKTIGDAFLLTFETPTDAILAAIDAQVALRTHNAGVTQEARIEVRMGINSGEVTVIEGDVYGDAVNIASRIESAAEANEIFFSETVFLTMNKPEIHQSLKEHSLTTAEVGFRSLRGVADEVRIYRIYSEGRSAGPRTVELDTTAATDLTLDEAPAAAARDGGSVPVQPLAEIDLAPSGSLEIEPAPSGSLEIERAPQIDIAPVRRPTRPRPRPPGRVSAKPEKRAGRRWIRLPALLVATLISCGGLMLLGAGVVLQSVWIAFAGALVLATASPLRLGLRHVKTLIVRGVALGLLVLMVTVFNATPLKEIQLRLDGMATQLRQDGGEGLGVRDRAAVWVMELLHVGHVARRGYREAARQQLYRLWPGRDSRSFSSDLAMRAPTLLRPLVDLNRRLEIAWHRGVKEVPIGPMELRLRPGQDPPRVMAAMPTFRLGGKAVRKTKGWELQVVALVPVHCPAPGPAPVCEINGVTLVMEQALCTHLEKKGWLSAYTAKWSWSLSSDDPRLTIGAGAGARPRRVMP